MADIILTPGTLPPPTCYATEQERFNAYVAAIISTISGGIEWEASQVAPTDLTMYWLRLDSSNRPVEALKWSSTDGAWVRWQSEFVNTGISGGVANAYTLTNTPAFTVPTAYRVGAVYLVVATANNTGASTLNIDGLGAKPIVYTDGVTPVVQGDIKTGQVMMLAYDGTSFQLVTTTANATQHGSQLITSTGSGNFTVPGGVFSIEVECVGGGGGGDFTNSGNAFGGGGGGYCYKRWSVSPGQVIPYTIGSGGVRTSPENTATNTNGNDTSFNTTQIAYGGLKGSSGGTGGTFVGADYGFNGTDGIRVDGDGKWMGGIASFQGSQGGALTASDSYSTPGYNGGGGAGDNDPTGNGASAGGAGLILIKW